MTDPARLPADLRRQDDQGNHLALVEPSAFRPAVVYPGALVLAGEPDSAVLATVLRTELFDTAEGRTLVLVTFRPELSERDRHRFDWWWRAHGAD